MKLVPAGISELAHCAGNCSPFRWSALVTQAAAGPCWALVDDDGLAVAVAGLVPIAGDGGGGWGGWFHAGPGARAHVGPIVRAMRLTLRTGRYRGVVARVHTPAGRRIAQLCGFRPVEGELWRFDGP